MSVVDRDWLGTQKQAICDVSGEFVPMFATILAHLIV